MKQNFKFLLSFTRSSKKDTGIFITTSTLILSFVFACIHSGNILSRLLIFHSARSNLFYVYWENTHFWYCPFSMLGFTFSIYVVYLLKFIICSCVFSIFFYFIFHICLLELYCFFAENSNNWITFVFLLMNISSAIHGLDLLACVYASYNFWLYTKHSFKSTAEAQVNNIQPHKGHVLYLPGKFRDSVNTTFS